MANTEPVGWRTHPDPKKPGWLTEVLSRIGWTKHHLSRVLGVDKNLPLRWDRGEHGVPKVVEHWLLQLAAAHGNLPPPKW